MTDFVDDADILHFFLDRMHVALAAYAPGAKPDVLRIQFGDKLLVGDDIVAQLNYQKKYIELLQQRLANCRG